MIIELGRVSEATKAISPVYTAFDGDPVLRKPAQ